MRPTSEILIDALESFEGGKRWIKDRLLNTVPGAIPNKIVPVKLAAEAESFCAVGAIYRSIAKHGELTGPMLNYDEIKGVCNNLAKFTNGDRIVNVNDYAKNFTPVKELFCKAIKHAVEQEQKEQEVSTDA